MAEKRKTIRCKECDHDIECCEFCESPDCPKAICYRCMVVELGEAVREPHDHGG